MESALFPVCSLLCRLPVSEATVPRMAVLLGDNFHGGPECVSVCNHGERTLGVSQALRKAGAHKYKPKNQVFLPAGINCHRGFSYDQRGQRDKLLPQIPRVAGNREVLVSSLVAFIVLCPPCHQRGWGSPPTWPGLSSSL